jgi:hypothetical protein
VHGFVPNDNKTNGHVADHARDKHEDIDDGDRDENRGGNLE